MLRAILAVAVSLAIIGWIAWGLERAGAPIARGGEALEQGPRERVELAAASAPDALVREVVEDLLASRDQVIETLGPQLLVADETAATVSGQIWGADGSLLPRHKIGFSPGGIAYLSSYSDDEGAYRVRLPAGDYRVLYYGNGGPQQNSRIVGRLRVESYETATYDVVLHGDRSLRGRYSLMIPELLGDDENGETVLLLELRRFWNADDLVATGSTAISMGEDDAQEDPDAGSTSAPAALPTPATQRLSSGSFRFPALEPDLYVLRIIAGETEEGEVLYLEREVDLSAGDLELEEESFSLMDFIRAMQRRG